MASVLVVDDSLVMRKNLKSLLTQAGYTIADEATNGTEAYNKYRKNEPDFVTMDVNMPDMDGIEAVKLIMSNYPNARIVMISGVDDKEKVMDALEAGAKYYILKPITYEKVLEVMEKIAI